MRQVAWVVALAMVSSSAFAKAPKKVAVMDIPPDANFSANVTKVLNSFLAGAVRDQGFIAITSSDVGAALGFERQKQLFGCSESSCMAEIGGALGADYILHGEVAALESNTAVTLSLIDVNGRSVGQVREIVKGKTSEALLAAIERLVPQLMAKARPAGEVPPAALAPAVSQPASSHSDAPAYALLGVGAAGLVASGVFGLLAHGKQGTVNQQAATGAVNPDDASALKRDAWISTGSLGVGLVAAGVGAAMLLLGDGGDGQPAGAPLAMRF